MLLEGLQLPLTTPFFPDGRLNVRKLEHNVARYSKMPVAGLVALSQCGEPRMLADDETRQVLRSVAEMAAPEKVLVAGVSRDSVMATVDLAEYAAGVGYDAVLVRCPTLSGGYADGGFTKTLLTYLCAVADRSSIPVVLYSPAGAEGSMLSPEIVAELAGHPRIIGLVDGDAGAERIAELRLGTAAVRHQADVTATFAAVTRRMRVGVEGDAPAGLVSADSLTSGGTAVAHAPSKPVIKTRTKMVGFQLLTACTTGMLDGLLAGAVGAMPGLAAAAPQACYEVLAAWKDEDEGLAQEKQVRLYEAARRVEVECGVAGIKYGCDLNGYFGGWARLPQLPLSGEERTEVEGLMQELRN